jgi:serine/threonine protein kinase
MDAHPARHPSDQTRPGTVPPGLAEHPNYDIKRELGRGGMGVVYLAHNKLMGRDEVLKVMGRQIMDRPGALERFLREIRAVAKLRHPNIVTAYHATHMDENIVLAMEYVKGYDLAQLVKGQGPLPVALACNFVHQAALGLQHAHDEGLVHRDIKPGNLMLSRSGRKPTVKVLDFGLAKATREEKVDGTLTSEGQALGTPDFIAPEQILNAPTADIRADIYSLGGTLFYLLCGRPPFQANSLYDIYQAHISRDAGPLNLIRPEVPAGLAALVAKMMAKDPARRLQTHAEVARSLTPFFKTGIAPHEVARLAVTPGWQSTVNDAASVSVAVPIQPATEEATGQTAPKQGAAGPTDANAPWQGLIELKGTDLLIDRAPAVAPVRRAPIPVWVAASAAGLLGSIAVAALTSIVIDTTDGRKVVARDKKPSSLIPPEVKIENVPAPENHSSRGDVNAQATQPAKRPEPLTLDATVPPPPVVAEHWVSLFNGKDKTGWATHPSQPDNWRVENGILSAAGPEVSHLYTKRSDYKDIHVRAEARVDDGGNGGVHIRSAFGPARPSAQPMFPISYEAPINCTHPNANKTGSLFLPDGNAVNCPESPVPPGEWMTLEMIARGRHITVKVNGNVTTDYNESGPSYPQQGHIALLRYPRLGGQPHRPEALIEFRKIEVKELDR